MQNFPRKKLPFPNAGQIYGLLLARASVKYAAAKQRFNLENIYFDMILEVLTQFYADEYEMLSYLAMEDKKTFDFFVQEDSSIINHLIGYGLIRHTDSGYDFNLDAIKEYILRKSSAAAHVRKHPV